MAAKREFRLTITGELRAETQDDKQFISGYAAVFNSLSEEMWGFREKIMPGAFSRTLRENADVRQLINHDSNLVLGRTKAGTLELSEDTVGLKFRCQMPKTSYAADLMESIKRGDVTQCSFGFMTRKQAWIENDTDETSIRELHDVDLFDTSVVTFPAYPDTSVSSQRELRQRFPDGIPGDIREHRNDQCECQCGFCRNGDCENCDNPNCDDPNCEGHDDPEEGNNSIRAANKKKTRSVSGAGLTADKFAFVGDPENIATWALPIHHHRHILISLHEFSACTIIPDEQRDKVWKALTTAAQKFGIAITEKQDRARKVDTVIVSASGTEQLADNIANIITGVTAFSVRAKSALQALTVEHDDAKVRSLLLSDSQELRSLLAEFVAASEPKPTPAVATGDDIRKAKHEIAKRL